jgi:hypothetical protein
MVMERLSGENSFDRYLSYLQERGPRPFYEAVPDVCDTAFMARVWLETYLPEKFVGGDVVALADLILCRELAREREVKG